ncbi:FAD binding domain-containing protein [Falsibacillus albus]|uniref:Xanthine dehydrogenase n=1 Tax=Falsibacillus albus TaxID=2478915 RepID=A0A3L7JXR0_9BACI|nr:FAD binding domain-containing protein [Falsibacillus albus]RLQ95533.1 xanthine dehydrogenase [Falsibacillus albus]
MLTFPFDYFRPITVSEALQTAESINRKGAKALYYGGGTEILTLGRLGMYYADAMIDIKNIPLCKVYQSDDEFLYIGSALTLMEIDQQAFFPLLRDTVKEIADHTSRNKITIGGNICGKIFYREAVLPLLLTDSLVLIASPGEQEMKYVNIHDIFNQEIQLAREGFIILFSIPKKFITMPYHAVKKRQQWDTGYPLITLNGMRVDDEIRVAVSGLCPFPFRSLEMEKKLNMFGASIEHKVTSAMNELPDQILDDQEGSSEYRLFVFKNMLLDMLKTIGGGLA